jgi:hypothetical protein
VAVAAAIAAAAMFVRRRRARTPKDPRTGWACECGQEYLVQGTDRHRVYWLPGADRADPLLGRECVGCGAPLLQSASAPAAEAAGAPNSTSTASSRRA